MGVKFIERTGKWQADFTDQFGKRHRHGFETRREAKEYQLKHDLAVRDRTYRPDAGKTTVAQVGQKWLAAEELRMKRGEIERTSFENTQAFVGRYLTRERTLHGPKKARIEPKLFHYPIGQMMIGDLSEVHVEEFRGALADLGYRKATIDNASTALGMMLAWAKVQRFVATNVARGQRRRRTRAMKPDRPNIPEKETVAKLIEHAPVDHRLLILFAATTGLRTSEQRALQWRHIDLDQRRVTVERRVDAHGDIGPPKSEAGFRSVPLSPHVVTELGAHKARLKSSGRDDLVFPSGRATMIYHANLLKNVWAAAWKGLLAAWEGDEPPEQCGWHGLRHFAISTWIEKEVPVKQVQKWAGHATAAMTLDIYGHLFKSADHSHAIDAIADDLFGNGK